jgi:protein-tyrosine-phosphatase
VSIASAGLLAGGYGSPPEVVSVLAELGIDLSGHTSTQLSPELVAGADMIVGMARRHAREVVLLDAGAFSRTFTLKDLVGRGDLVGPRAPGESLPDWMVRLDRGRQRTDLVGTSSADDVPDPLGGSLEDFRATARELGALVEHLAGLLWADRPVRTSSG